MNFIELIVATQARKYFELAKKELEQQRCMNNSVQPIIIITRTEDEQSE